MSRSDVNCQLILGNIRLDADCDIDDALAQARNRMKKTGIPLSSLDFRLYRRSVDARRRDRISLVFSVAVSAKDDTDLQRISPKTLSALDAKIICDTPLTVTSKGTRRMSARPLVVGMGPAGLFCALLLAENGYRPILIDRGDDVAGRVRSVQRFHADGVLDTESNIQFGAGGAGTFSDGKLLTRINDARCSYVLRRLHEFGAPEDILYQAKPHVGTDVLRGVVDGILSHIKRLGGELHYRTRFDGAAQNSDGTLTVHTSAGTFLSSLVVLAIGHSARDTYQTLIRQGFDIIPKPISVGVRIEHLQKDIDRALYGELAGCPNLGPGEYALSDTRRQRGVYTFCMCPGGEVVAAASEQGGVVVNGMSHHARNGKNANCAVAVSLYPKDYLPVDGNAALGAIAYQRSVEQAAFLAGGCDYSAPIQTVGDFMRGEARHEPSRVLPTYRGGQFVKVCDLSGILPPVVTDHLRYGLGVFDQRIHGFAADDAVLTGVETRTSAPVRILRGDDYCAIGRSNIYPCGEGAGYAGGITSAAVDGLRVAMAIIEKYAPITA